MQLTTLMEILEQEIGVSHSARSTLAALVAERGLEPTAAPARAGAAKPRKDRPVRRRTPARAG